MGDKVLEPSRRLGAGAEQRSSLDIAQLVALSHLTGAAPYGPPNENPFVQLYEAATGETLDGMELFRAPWLFQLGVVYYGWKASGREPWFTWAQVDDLLTRSLAEL